MKYAENFSQRINKSFTDTVVRTVSIPPELSIRRYRFNTAVAAAVVVQISLSISFGFENNKMFSLLISCQFCRANS